MATVSWLAFKTELRSLIWPYPNEAKSLKSAHDAAFLEAIVDIQTWVRQLQRNHTDVFPFCATLFECNKTLVAAPRGVIQRVYTINTDSWCDKVLYQSAKFVDVEAWARQLIDTPANTAAVIQQGIQKADDSTDNTCGSKRARRGIWAIYRRRLHIAPYIQSTESLVVEWDGVKGDWLDTDLLDTDLWGVSEKEAIKLFVRASHEKFFGNPQMGKMFEEQYNDRIADMIWDYNQQVAQQEVISSPMDRMPTSDELEADEG